MSRERTVYHPRPSSSLGSLLACHAIKQCTIWRRAVDHGGLQPGRQVENGRAVTDIDLVVNSAAQRVQLPDRARVYGYR
jgi:hypothetical protein